MVERNRYFVLEHEVTPLPSNITHYGQISKRCDLFLTLIGKYKQN